MAISEWDQRQLCPDGACVGVIGPDGTCKTCGRVAPDWGDERRRGLVAADGEPGEGEGDATEGDGGGDEDEISPSAPAVLGEMAEWQRRQLCADGSCVGVIGSDGRCKVCGKAASAEAEAEADDDDEAGDEDEAAGDDEAAADDEAGGDDDEAAAADDEAGDEDADDDDDDDEAEAAAAGDGDPGDRKLCPDGACIGVIGQDGRCKVCGKEAA